MLTNPTIYTQHDAAFANVSAFVVLNKENERVATIAFKFPRDGAGRLCAYVHWIGVEMVRGHANGYGYDKRSAAVESATEKLIANARLSDFVKRPDFSEATCFVNAVKDCGGDSWDSALRNAGFIVFQAV